MLKKIIVDVNQMETRVAVLEDGDLVEVYIERKGHERLVGNIYKGVVQNVLPGMQAAFVDIGLDKNAFLYARDILADHSAYEIKDADNEEDLKHINIKDLIKQGDEILVQVFKEPGGSKGTRVTKNITLPGRSLVLMPTVDYIGVSRRIDDENERTRLKDILKGLLKPGFGVIARTAAKDKDEEYLENEIQFLQRLWTKLDEKNKKLKAPRLIHSEEGLIYRTVRDMLSDDITEFLVNDQDAYEKITIIAQMLAGNLSDKISKYEAPENIFDYFGIEEKIDKALARRVWLKSGGYIVIDHTEALTVVDVNTGKYVGNVDFCKTALKTNLEAAKEVARQMRLRDISGIIVIDFIDMLEEQDRNALLNELNAELERDKTKTNVIGISDLGLVEITRKKERKSLTTSVYKPCPYCQGLGKILNDQSIAIKIYKALDRKVNNTATGIIVIKLHTNASEYITEVVKEWFFNIEGIETRNIYLYPSNSIHEQEFEISVFNSLKELKGNRYVKFIG